MTLFTTLLALVLLPADYEPGQLPRIYSSTINMHLSDTVSLESLLALDKQKFVGGSVTAFISSPEARGFTAVVFRKRDQNLEAIRLKYTEDLYLQLNLGAHPALSEKEGEEWSIDALKEVPIEEIGVIYIMHDR